MNITCEADVVYAEPADGSLTLDLYTPAGIEPDAGIVFVHGGAWRSGDKGVFEPHARRLAKAGYLAVDITYRLRDCPRQVLDPDSATFPQAAQDVKAAIQWLRATRDVERIAVVGESAGAHLSALAAVTPDHPDLQPESPYDASTRVQAAIPYYGIFDFVPIGKRFDESAYAFSDLTGLDQTIGDIGLMVYERVIGFMGRPYHEIPDQYELASPIRHANADAPPFLFIHGTDDRQLPHRESVDFRDRLRAEGGHAELLTVEGGIHGLFDKPQWYEQTITEVERFLDAQMPL